MNPSKYISKQIENLDHIPYPVLVTDHVGMITETNALFSHWFQYSAAELQQNIMINQIFGNVDEHLYEKFFSLANAQFTALSFVTKNENMLSGSLLKNVLDSGRILWLFVVETEIFDKNSQLYIDLYNGISNSFMLTTIDADGFILSCNQAFLKKSGWTPKRVIGKTYWRLFPEADKKQMQAKKVWETLKNGNTWQGDIEKATKEGQTYWVHLTAIPTENIENNELQFILIEKDITQEKSFQHQLEKIAYIDTQTGLMNVHRLEQIINEMIEDQRHFSFVYLSIDKFYTLKDLQGYVIENNFIIDFTKRLKMYFQDSTMARINENEFVVLTPLPEWFTQGFLTYLQQNPIYNENGAVPLSISGGITRYPEDQSTFGQLMKASLATISTVREAGGNNIVSLSKSMQKALNRKSIIEKRLLVALNQKNLKVLYQPQIDLNTERMIAVEAFVRWHDEEIGVVSPDELIPIAEETGLINRIGTFMLEQACSQAAKWHKAGLQLKVSINSSVREFLDKNMAKSILDTLERTGCPSNLLQIEITEKFALEAEAETSIIKQMRQLESEGIVFILDDFGTGYASFRYMQLLPINVVKIDQTFTQSLLQSDKTQRVVDGMVQFGKSMNFTVLAEGVETEQQKDILKEFGCDCIQGYLIAKPSEPEFIEQLYRVYN